MKKESLVIGIAGLVIGLVLGPYLIPSPYEKNGMMNQGSMMGGQMMGQIDSHFIEQMIPHHEDAITMAQLALTEAEHSELKKLSNNIIKSQSEEIDQMKKWYQEWSGKEVNNMSSMMGHGMNMMTHGGMMGDKSDLEDLKEANPFDKAFIEQMIPHHQMAVMMAQMLLNSSERTEMRQLAKNIISDQNKEIEQMRSWYDDWYK